MLSEIMQEIGIDPDFTEVDVAMEMPEMFAVSEMLSKEYDENQDG